MKIVDKPINKLIPYAKNAKKHDETQINRVAQSIKQFGFVQPLVISKDNSIIIGHCRYEASKKLGLKNVPCVIADDLTEEEINSLRLIDNKLNESAWDEALVNEELENIFNIDMGFFGFEIPELELPDEDSYFGDERERTINTYNLNKYDPGRVDGFYQMPVIKKEDHIPEDIISFNYMLSSKDKNKGIHFYCDDYQFERIWSQPEQYIEKMSDFDCVFTPDFSLYLNMPMAMKVWNVYRSRLIGQMCQDMGLTVIPTLSWAEEDTFKFCFDGIEPGGTVSVSTIGVKQDENATKIWIAGMDEAIKKLKPKTILVYGGDIGYDFEDIKVVYYKNHTTDRLKESKKNGN